MQENNGKGLPDQVRGVPIDIVVDPRMSLADRKLRARAIVAQACKDAGVSYLPNLIFSNKPLPGPKPCLECKNEHQTGKAFCSPACCKTYTEKAKEARKAIENATPRTRNRKKRKK